MQTDGQQGEGEREEIKENKFRDRKKVGVSAHRGGGGEKLKR